MSTNSISHGFFTVWYDDEIPENIVNLLDEKLPHGSGIDFNWSLEFDVEKQAIIAENAYHAMDEYGGYCHVWPFVVTIPVFVNNEQITGINYEHENFADINFVDCDPEKDCPEQEWLDDYYSEFEPDPETGEYDWRITENAPGGCGFGVDEYLEDTLYWALRE